MLFTLWMCLSITELVHGKVVTINNHGDIVTECCLKGLCLCNSIHTALSFIENNTIVNITSEIVSLPMRTAMGSGNLHNITITGNGATIMCNNSGSVHCESCSDVIIEGITWDKCGDPSKPNISGILFEHITNLMIFRCVFQWSRVCSAVNLSTPEGHISILASMFLYNSIKSMLPCPQYSSLLVWNPIRKINLTISNSLFSHNGLQTSSLTDPGNNGSLYCWSLFLVNTFTIFIENTIFSSNGITSMFIYDFAISSSITLVNVTVFNNSNGGLNFFSTSYITQFDISLSDFSQNTNGALSLRLSNYLKSSCNIRRTNFTENKGTSDGVALHISVRVDSDIRLSFCKFNSNTGGDSIVYVASISQLSRRLGNIYVTSCWFTNNTVGSALHLSLCLLNFYNSSLFQNNLAENGAAIYFEHNSLVTIDNDTIVQFINNTALAYGGVIYADVGNCQNHGILFNSTSDYNFVTFVNNSAEVSGHSIYFNIPASCDVVRDETSNDSVVHIPYKFTYSQRRDTIGPAVATSPYEIKLCSPADCSVTNNDRSTCLIEGTKMLGQSIDFNATVCDYYNVNAEAVKFQISCINCGSKFQLSINELLAFNGSSNSFIVQATDTTHDIRDNLNITLNISSVLSHEYEQFTATLSLTLQSCYSGFVFDSTSQQCECYKHDNDIVQCFEDQAEIKQEYWFGVLSDSYTVSICPNSYCNFVNRQETRTGYFTLSGLLNAQCSPHRRGPACGECSPGYSLSYDTPDCVSNDKCSTGITVLVVVLTMLYWIALIVIFLAVMYHFTQKIPLGYLYGVIYFYSIVDIVLVDKLYISHEVFYTISLLSSAAKLTPQFLGKFCFIKELDAIDQQFIHYSHVLCVWFTLMVILIVAKHCNAVARYVNRSITLFTGLFLLLSYTTIASTSLQLLRALQYNDVDEVYVYLSPQLKYFTGRHAAYGSVALVCGLVIVLGLPVLLVVEPLLKKRNITIKKVTPLMNRFQDCYTEKYSWFAAYYLICRLVIMLIVYFANSDYSNMIYYLQTACVIIAMTHVLIRPYKNDLLNVMDTVILLIMLMVVNPGSFNFSQSLITGIYMILVLFPLCLALTTWIYMLFKHVKDAQLSCSVAGENNQDTPIR